jgi:hypothetical protein
MINFFKLEDELIFVDNDIAYFQVVVFGVDEAIDESDFFFASDETSAVKNVDFAESVFVGLIVKKQIGIFVPNLRKNF